MPYDIVEDSVGENAEGERTEVYLVRVLRSFSEWMMQENVLFLPVVINNLREVAEGCLHLHADGFDIMSKVTDAEFVVTTHRCIQLHDMQDEKNEDIERKVQEAAESLRGSDFEFADSLFEVTQRYQEQGATAFHGVERCECSFPIQEGVHYCPFRGKVYDGRTADS